MFNVDVSIVDPCEMDEMTVTANPDIALPITYTIYPAVPERMRY